MQDDAELYAAIADQVDGPILELGCGSGRLLESLANAGHRVTGLDMSRVMLERARARIARTGLAERVTLFEGDMEAADGAPGGPFGLVLFSLNALMHIEHPSRQVNALRAAHKAMRQHGQVIVDVVNPTPHYLVDLGRGPIHEWSTELEDGSAVDKWSVRAVDAIEQTLDTTLWYDQVSASGTLIRHRAQFRLRYVHPNELLLMLECCGYSDARLFGSIDLDPLTEASERIIAIAGVQ